MATLNSVTLLGNLTRDPELRSTPKGTNVVKFGLALNRSITDASGAKKDYVTFVDIEAWGKLADVCNTYLKKGRQVVIVGELRMDSWVDKESGKNRSRLYVVGHNVQFLSKPGGSKDEDPSAATTEPEVASNEVDADIPF